MISSSLVKTSLRQDTLYKTLISVLGDLEVRYNKLLSGQRWLGVGHGVQAASSAFITNTDLDTDTFDEDEYDDYMVLTARNGRAIIPFDIWVKDKVCRNCNAVGHIQCDCPKQCCPSSRPSSRQPTHYYNHRHSTSRSSLDNSASTSPASLSTQQSLGKHGLSAKVQALISASCDLAQVAEPLANTATTLGDEVKLSSMPSTKSTDRDTSTHDYTRFFAALGYPKE